MLTNSSNLIPPSNNNNNPTTTIVGNKPEAIVRPQRRRDDIKLRSLDIDENVDVQEEKLQKEIFKENLKRINNRRSVLKDLKKSTSRDGSSSTTLEESNLRPLFITTVPRGIFLPQPPPSREIVVKNRLAFTYASRPRILLPHLQKLTATSFDQIDKSSENAKENPAFVERRVVRGAAYNCLHVAAENNDYLKREEEAKRRQILRKRQIARNQRGIIGTPPTRGRKHETIQTERYLEEIFQKPSEKEQYCQTDLFLHQPVTATHVPSKFGVDASTEILDGELFDFDVEVQPILNNLIGKTLQQALSEVVQEEEIAELREQQQKILALHETEIAELRRIEQQERQTNQQKQNEIERSDSMEVRMTAAKLLQGHIAELLPSVLESIETLRDAENKEILQKKLTPWLAEEVATEIGQMIDSHDLLLEIVKEVLQHRAEIYARLDDEDSEM